MGSQGPRGGFLNSGVSVSADLFHIDWKNRQLDSNGAKQDTYILTNFRVGLGGEHWRVVGSSITR